MFEGAIDKEHSIGANILGLHPNLGGDCDARGGDRTVIPPPTIPHNGGQTEILRSGRSAGCHLPRGRRRGRVDRRISVLEAAKCHLQGQGARRRMGIELCGDFFVLRELHPFGENRDQSPLTPSRSS